MPSLKLAEESDWPEVLRMSRAFHEFSPYNHIPFSEIKIRRIFESYLKDPNRVIVILGEFDGEIKGVIVALVDEFYFSTERTAGEIIWWVDEDVRGSPLGKNLFDAFEYWGRQVGAKFINCTNTSGTTDLGRFYEKHGYHLAESVYIKEIK